MVGLRTVLNLGILGLAAAESSVVSLYLWDADPQPLAASVVAVVCFSVSIGTDMILISRLRPLQRLHIGSTVLRVLSPRIASSALASCTLQAPVLWSG
jgi:hypothetical protein